MQAAIPNACVFLLSWLFVFSLGMCFNVLSFFVEPKWLLPVFVIVVFIFAVQMQHAVEIKGQWWLNPICHFYIKLHTVYSTLSAGRSAGEYAGLSALALGCLFCGLYCRLHGDWISLY